jgi:NTP pyrophosphatase (non-canonical NTP hydrolase)
MTKIDLNDYRNFVLSVTSPPSLSLTALTDRIHDLQTSDNSHNVVWPEILTAAIGLQAETGEFAEIVKKCIFQGKEMDADAQFHAKRELGDIMWYWIHAVTSLRLDPNDVLQENINKLEQRYPGGFDIARSEKREEGDI